MRRRFQKRRPHNTVKLRNWQCKSSVQSEVLIAISDILARSHSLNEEVPSAQTVKLRNSQCKSPVQPNPRYSREWNTSGSQSHCFGWCGGWWQEYLEKPKWAWCSTHPNSGGVNNVFATPHHHKVNCWLWSLWVFCTKSQFKQGSSKCADRSKH